MAIIFKNKKTKQVTRLFEGAVLVKDYERNFYNDSDFYCVVWNEEKQRIEHYEIASTRYYDLDLGDYDCIIQEDATVSSRSKALKYSETLLRRKIVEELKLKIDTVDVGKKIKVVRGRKHRGRKGTVLRVVDHKTHKSVLIEEDKTKDQFWYYPNNMEITGSKKITEEMVQDEMYSRYGSVGEWIYTNYKLHKEDSNLVKLVEQIKS